MDNETIYKSAVTALSAAFVTSSIFLARDAVSATLVLFISTLVTWFVIQMWKER
jgi:hypothetical protein